MIATYANLIIQIRVHIEKFHDKPLKSTLRRISRFSRHIARRLNKELKRCEMYSSTHFFCRAGKDFHGFPQSERKGRRGDLLTCEKLPNMGSNKRWQESPLPWRWQYQQQQQQKQKRKLKTRDHDVTATKKTKTTYFRHGHDQNSRVWLQKQATHTERQSSQYWSGKVDKSRSWQCLRRSLLR